MRAVACAMAMFCVPALAGESAGLKERLAGMELRLPTLAGMKLEDTLSVEAGGLRTEELRAVSTGGERRARIVVTTGANSGALDSLLRARRASVEAAYSVKNPGDGTLSVKSCFPTENGSAARSAFSLLADERLAFGICDQAKAKYRAVAVFLACHGRAVEVYYYFPPKESPKPALRQLLATDCGKEGEGFGI